MLGNRRRRRKSFRAMADISPRHTRENPPGVGHVAGGRLARRPTLPAMRYQRLDLNLLSALRALLTERNVTRAAEQLHITQPAMSGALGRLRDFFEDPLIVPVGRRMELTPLGQALQGRVDDLMLRLDATLATRPAFEPATAQRRFSVVASDYVIQVLLLELLQRLHHVAPGITLEFRQPSSTAGQDLENGDVDFVIVPERFAVPGQPSALLFEDGYDAVVDIGHPHVGRRINLADYRSARHVRMENAGRPMFESWFEALHGELPHTDVVVNHFGLLPLLLPGTQRLATLHSRMAQQVVQRHPGLRLVVLDFAPPRLVELLQWHRYREDDPGSQWLRGQILQAAAALAPAATTQPPA